MQRRSFLMVPLCGRLLPGEDPISGTWEMTMDTPGGERKAKPRFSLEGENVSGKWDASEVKGRFRNGQLELQFPLASGEAGYEAEFKVSAKLEGAVLKGTWSWSTYGGALTGKKQSD